MASRAWLAVGLLLAGPTWAPFGSASEPAFGWSWESDSVEGSLAVRLGLSFPDQAACTFQLVAWFDVLEDAHEVFMARDDLAQNTFMADQEGGGSFWASDLPGMTDVISARAGGRDGLLVTNVAQHGPYENWIFSGQGLRGNGYPEPTFEISITCDRAFIVETTQVAREIAFFQADDTCGGTQGVLCGQAIAVQQEGAWEMGGPDTIMRLQHKTLVADAGTMQIHGPDDSDSATFAATAMTEPVALRIDGGAGVYGYTMTMTSATYMTAGYVWSFHPVSSVDEWVDLPTL